MTNPKHTDTSRSGDLKPCPFCGGEAKVYQYRNRGTGSSGMETPEPYIRCEKCGAEQPRVQCDDSPWGRKENKKTYVDAEAEAIDAWNNRPADRIEALEAEIERLAHAWEAQHGEKVKEHEEARLWFEKAQTWKAEVEGLHGAATALRDDLVNRAKMNAWQNDGEIVVEAGAGVWARFCAALGEK